MTEYKICNRCVMDTSDCEITFDEKGNCNHCDNYYVLQVWHIKAKSLIRNLTH